MRIGGYTLKNTVWNNTIWKNTVWKNTYSRDALCFSRTYPHLKGVGLAEQLKIKIPKIPHQKQREIN